MKNFIDIEFPKEAADNYYQNQTKAQIDDFIYIDKEWYDRIFEPSTYYILGSKGILLRAGADEVVYEDPDVIHETETEDPTETTEVPVPASTWNLNMPSSEKTDMKSSESTEVKSSENTEVKSSENTEVKSSENTEVKSSESTEVKSSENTEVKSSESTQVKSSESTEVKSSENISDTLGR